MRYFLFSYYFTCAGRMGFGSVRIKAGSFPPQSFVKHFATEQINKSMGNEVVFLSIINFQEFQNEEDFNNFSQDDNFSFYQL